LGYGFGPAGYRVVGHHLFAHSAQASEVNVQKTEYARVQFLYQANCFYLVMEVPKAGRMN
jgi:hypothetical protein